MKKYTWILLFGLGFFQAAAQQTLNLDSCIAKARLNYPLIRQYQLLEQSLSYSLSNAAKAYYPQVQVFGQASYQSDVINAPTGIPGQTRPVLEKDQYKFYAELQQNIYDGGYTRLNKQVLAAQNKAEAIKVNTDMYAVEERVEQLYFGLLLLQLQLKQQELLLSDLSAALTKLKAQVAQGLALRSNEEVLQADLIKMQQKKVELQAAKTAYLQMLAAFIGENISDEATILTPKAPVISKEIARPELSLFAAQQFTLQQQSKLLAVKTRPKLSAFAQGGYAYPAFDFFKNAFDWYYIGGIRLNWNMSSFYTLGREKKILDLQSKMISVQQDNFLFNLQLAYTQQQSETAKYVSLLQSDEDLVKLRKSIKDRAITQLESGTLLPADYLREVNAEDAAIQNQLIHQMQWLQLQYSKKHNRGN